MLKILQARLQHCKYRELPVVQAEFRKGRGSRDQIDNIHWIIEKKKKRVLGKHLLLFYWLCQSLCVDHRKLWKILKEIGIPDQVTCLLRNLYAGQEATVRTGCGMGLVTNWERSKSRLYCHPACLTYMQSTLCEMPGWMKHKLESRLPGET